MDNSTHLAQLQGHGLMAQDKIIAIQQECEEICLQKVIRRTIGRCLSSSLPVWRRYEDCWS